MSRYACNGAVLCRLRALTQLDTTNFVRCEKLHSTGVLRHAEPESPIPRLPTLQTALRAICAASTIALRRAPLRSLADLARDARIQKERHARVTTILN